MTQRSQSAHGWALQPIKTNAIEQILRRKYDRIEKLDSIARERKIPVSNK